MLLIIQTQFLIVLYNCREWTWDCHYRKEKDYTETVGTSLITEVNLT